MRKRTADAALGFGFATSTRGLSSLVSTRSLLTPTVLYCGFTSPLEPGLVDIEELQAPKRMTINNGT